MIGQAVDSVLEELEFAPPCENRLGDMECEHVADWAISATHSRISCPAAGFICGPCKDAVVAGWAEKLRDGAPPCRRCGGTVKGQVSDNLRFIPL